MQVATSLFLLQANCRQADWESNQFELGKIKLRKVKNYSNLKSKPKTKDQIIKEVTIAVNQWMSKDSIPGLVIGLSSKGKTLWTKAFGLMDIENNVKTHKESVWRLASISKPLT